MTEVDMAEVMRRVMSDIQGSMDRGLLRAYGLCQHCQRVVDAEFEPDGCVRGKIVRCPHCGGMAAVERGGVDIPAHSGHSAR